MCTGNILGKQLQEFYTENYALFAYPRVDVQKANLILEALSRFHSSKR